MFVPLIIEGEAPRLAVRSFSLPVEAIHPL